MSKSALGFSSKSNIKSRTASTKIKDFPIAPPEFLKAFYQHVTPEDKALFSADERQRIASSIWTWASARLPGKPIIRVFNPSVEREGWTVDHTVIEVVNDDMPFLVDSVTGVLQKRGIAIHIVIHPVIALRRDNHGKALDVAKPGDEGGIPESFMHIQIDHSFDLLELRSLEEEVRATLADVRAAVSDWPAMLDRVHEAQGDLGLATGKASEDDLEEMRAFLRWITDDNFTFLGYREIALEHSDDTVSSIRVVPKRGLGILRDDEARMFGGLRDITKRNTKALKKYHHQGEVLTIMKTQAMTRVHRVVPMDAIFVRRFNEKGLVVFERLFVGLFTSKAYNQTPRLIPCVRRKIANLNARMDFPPRSHNGRNLSHILNTYPHDELFQIGENELYANVMAILELQERARVALFLRRDPYDHYVTSLMYVPRDRYDSSLRKRVQKFLEDAYKGKALGWHIRIDDSLLARAFTTIRLSPDSPNPDPAMLENDVREMSRSWSVRLRTRLVNAYGEAEALDLLRRYGDVFPESYRDSLSTASAVQDIACMERMRDKPHFMVDVSTKSDGRLRLKLLQPEKPLLLSECLPLIENMGLKIDYMGGPYKISLKDSAPLYIHEFVGAAAFPMESGFDAVKPVFEEILTEVWRGEVENDAFNGLALRIGLECRDVILMRAFARYLRQLRIPYSHEMMASALLAHPRAALNIAKLFHVRHDPRLAGPRDAKMKALDATIVESLAQITALEEDRIVRRYLNLVRASLRTNFYQTDENGAPKPYLSIKFDSHAVEFMPLPKPLYEIFVYSPRVEAVHLRGGKVARGGIRWSDRRDDFRNEILSLMKAQMVKNTVIVPVGSKGGFIVKRPPSDAEHYRAEGIACYRTMMHGLLDITDNIKNGRVLPPKDTVRHDADDPYLVVAADKGTATFSDIANRISREYGFWLDDAFASGGSAGYDHKGMGITARGAWEAVKRHFREMGKDIQSESFTCIGVGDMSGDVFGNGMLLSPVMRLLGAFDHRHIFCDPNPDPVKSRAERKRLFKLPRSSWKDYDPKLISKGGGVFARTEKTIKISTEMKSAYGIAAETLSPAELIKAMLRAEVELIYFGGIGTYVKASAETHDEVGDRANEPMRVDANELRAQVVGEGANLAMTMRARIEYAQKGGRINTDAIDNSAGVDTSDHEVNIKILLRRALDRKALTFASRDKLLASMTDKIGDLVLRDNYLQTEALSVAEAQASERFMDDVRCMHELERSGLLNRAVEFLPNDIDIAERQRLGKGLTRPELAVLMAYVKLWLYEQILASKLPDDPALRDDLCSYFPEELRRKYAKDIAQHPLKREIAATVLTNDIVNRAGHRVLLAVTDHGGVDSVIRAYVLAREALELPVLWGKIESLDNKRPAQVQIRMLNVIQSGLEKATDYLLMEKASSLPLQAAIDTYRKGLSELALGQRAEPKSSADNEVFADAPQDLCRQLKLFSLRVNALDLVSLSQKMKTSVKDLASIFFGLETRLSLGLFAELAEQKFQLPWQREAVSKALIDLEGHHRRLTALIAAKKTKAPLAAWESHNAAKLQHYDELVNEGRAAGGPDLALLMLANERLNSFIA